jgi:aquaporin TIP/aquaporin related protein
MFAYAVLGDIGSPAITDPTVSWLFADFCGEVKIYISTQKVLGTFAFVLFIHIQVHPRTSLTDNDVIGIGIIVAGLFFGRMLTFHSGGFFIVLLNLGALNPAMGVSLAIFRSIKDQNY